jgi:ABC-type Mn2+/Zn2+ transport system ATPase subunit
MSRDQDCRSTDLPADEPAAISFRHVTVAFQDAFGIEDASFDIRSGSFTAVIGPNGSGKTTLLRATLGLVRPVSGTVTVLGRNGSGLARARRRIGYVPQRRPFDAMFPVTAFEVALMGSYGRLGILRNPGPPDRSRAMGSLEAVGLADRAGHVAGHLSGGQQQRLLIARALVQNPEILLLDEPTSAVDVASQRTIVQLVRSLHDKLKLTTVFVTHDINEVMPCVDRVLYLNRRVHAFGSCAEVLNAATLEQLYQTPVAIIQRDGRPYVIVSDRHA